ncbi:MAG: hypothetical protein WD342_06775 [Verrucomicrobiales bacterium]
MNFGKSLIFFACLGLGLFVASCETSGNRRGQVVDATRTGDGSGGASGFLKTDYEPLEKWLDERFEVDYKHMTPDLIFDQVPLNDIFYETSNLPVDAAPFNFSSGDVSRRELLKKVATHWKLKMSLLTDESGNPTAVKVKG